MKIKERIEGIIKDGEACAVTKRCEDCAVYPLWKKLSGGCERIVDVFKAVLGDD